MPSSQVMDKWKHGKLHSGSKKGPVVKNQKQAVAIMLSEKRAEQANGGKYPEKAMGGPMMGVANQAMGPMGVNPGQMMPQAPSPMAGPMAMAGGVGALPTAPRALAVGGIAMPGVGSFNMAKQANLSPGPMARGEDRQLMHGPILSSVAGRTDAHRGAVPSGSYVIPADIVSGRGQGNTIAGMNNLSKFFKMGPYGSPGGTIKPGRGAPPAMRPPKMQSQLPQIGAARGGAKEKHRHIGKPVPVNLAGGEFIVPPENLMSTVHPDLDTAHKIMDKWVVNERKKLRDKLGKLPGPVKD